MTDTVDTSAEAIRWAFVDLGERGLDNLAEVLLELHSNRNEITAERDTLAARVAELEAALEEVKQDTDARSINGIVPMGRTAYAMMCNALSKESEG